MRSYDQGVTISVVYSIAQAAKFVKKNRKKGCRVTGQPQREKKKKKTFSVLIIAHKNQKVNRFGGKKKWKQMQAA